ncbi:NAD(P)H-dependent flavin oxidoreductase [Nocardia sp. NPDC020380]|uniref:NAD(P)H-dependent flavin oxidoreductase n=1 Tax=Nocardia sp. NPDC020380 TaxID=3364309 RepID=UPI0037AB2E24
MALVTAFTELMDLRHPIALAPMGGSAGGALAAAVCEGGGLGLLGSARGDQEWLEREAGIVRAGTARPWGIGLWSWAVDKAVVQRVLEFRPAAVLLSFGDPLPFAELVRAAGAILILQVGDSEEARRAVDAGADVIVAQGNDAGGHGVQRGIGTLSFVPAVVDLAGGTPVLAAGGIADGRGLAAALALGAAGALVGTRFQVTPEALVSVEIGKALLEAGGADTERNRVLDIGRGSDWPARYPARTLRNSFLETWRGREDELRSDAAALAAHRAELASGAPMAGPIWAGQGLDLISGVESAETLVGSIAAEAERAVRNIRMT